MGQTIVGGLLGGLLGVELGKWLIGYKHSTGDGFIFPLTIAIIIGRTGCYLAGLHDGTYGIATNLPWGVDFGDGILRHPTQIYDQLFVISLALLIYANRRFLRQVSGLSFQCFLAGYLLWRLFIDSYKPVLYAYLFDLSGIQLGCIVAIFIYAPFIIKNFRKIKT